MTPKTDRRNTRSATSAASGAVSDNDLSRVGCTQCRRPRHGEHLTHVALNGVGAKLSSGQSLIASGNHPSSLPFRDLGWRLSHSRGWSRPIAIGALTTPVATNSLNQPRWRGRRNPASRSATAIPEIQPAHAPCPALQRFIIGKQIQNCFVGAVDVLDRRRVPPSGMALCLRKQWSDVRRHKTGIIERIFDIRSRMRVGAGCCRSQNDKTLRAGTPASL